MIQSPLFALALTLVGYELCEIVYLWSGRRLLLNPLLWSVALIIGVLLLTGLPYETYFAGAKPVHFLLGPATVALAVPLYEQRVHVRRVLIPLAAALVAGSLTSILLAGGLTLALGGSRALLFTLAPKSVTTPIAMAVAETFGGLPPLTAGVVVVTGVFGAATIPLLYAWLGGPLGLREGVCWSLVELITHQKFPSTVGSSERTTSNRRHHWAVWSSRCRSVNRFHVREVAHDSFVTFAAAF